MPGWWRWAVLWALLVAGHPAQAEPVLVNGWASPVVRLTREEAVRLYTGRLVGQSEGGLLRPLDLPAGSVRDEFYQRLTGKNPNQIRAYWSRLVFSGQAVPPHEAANVAEVRALVTRYPDLVGYLPEAEVDGSVRVLLRLE
jgi:hypothetical protein